MGSIVVLSTTAVTVEPGGTATVGVKITNTGQVVDEFTIGVVGEAAAWATAEPATVSLFPNAQGEATVRFHPPRSADSTAGAVAFGVRVASKEDAAGSRVEEGTLTVSPFRDVFVELVPRTSRGRRGAKHSFRVDNRGNGPLVASVVASDPDSLLRFRPKPAALDLGPGLAAFVSVEVRPRARFWRGPAQLKPFQVWAQEEGQPPVLSDGSFLQEPVLPPWLVKAALVVAALAIVLFVLWQTVLKPKIKSLAKVEATNAVAAQLGTTPAAAAAAAKTKAGGGALTPAGGAPSSGSGSSGTGTSGSASTGTGTAAPAVATTKQPIDGRLFLTASGTAPYVVPTGKQLQLTDIVLENPQGNTGQLLIQRSGTPLLVTELADFRDLDYHFVSPIVFGPGQKLELVANCTSPTCTPGAYFSGSLVDAS
ncbi:MAG TPA: hypothetical protein VF954_05240 [Acidimicrobiales bacterium]